MSHSQARPGRRGAGRLVGWMSTVALVAGLVVWGVPSGPTVSFAATPDCSTSHLVIWLNTTGNGAAGSSYYNVNLTNLGPGTCTLKGYPGVSAVSLTNAQVGRAAARDALTSPQVVTLTSARSARGLESSTSSNTATFILQITEVENYPATLCRQIAAAGLRVYPPGQRSAKVIAFPLAACAKTGPQYLHVEAVQKYVSVIQ